MAADLPPDERPRCTATSVMTGERCKRRPHPGSSTCVKHGSGAPQVRAAAERRVADAKAVELAARMEVEVPQFESAGAAARFLVNRVTRRAQQFGALADQLESMTYTDRGGIERLRAAIDAERKWLEAMIRVLGVAAQAESAGRGTASAVETFKMAVRLLTTDVDAALCDAGVFGEVHDDVMDRLRARGALRLSRSEGLITEQIRILSGAGHRGAEGTG